MTKRTLWFISVRCPRDRNASASRTARTKPGIYEPFPRHVHLTCKHGEIGPFRARCWVNVQQAIRIALFPDCAPFHKIASQHVPSRTFQLDPPHLAGNDRPLQCQWTEIRLSLLPFPAATRMIVRAETGRVRVQDSQDRRGGMISPEWPPSHLRPS